MQNEWIFRSESAIVTGWAGGRWPRLARRLANCHKAMWANRSRVGKKWDLRMAPSLRLARIDETMINLLQICNAQSQLSCRANVPRLAVKQILARVVKEL